MCVSTLTSKRISATLFVVCLPLIMFFVPFSCILTCKYMNHTYPVAVYTLNTWRTPYCLFLTTENVPFIFDAMIRTLKHRPYHFSIFKTSKYVRGSLVCCLFPSKYVICVVTLQFNLWLHQRRLSCFNLTSNTPATFCLLIEKCQKPWPYLSSSHVAFKNLNQTLFLASKLLNTLPAPYFMYFNL